MDDMADKLNMSRSNFYRKIKGVLDLSPNEFLRLEYSPCLHGGVVTAINRKVKQNKLHWQTKCGIQIPVSYTHLAT